LSVSSRIGKKAAESNLSRSQRVLLRCQFAREFEEAGDYEEAGATLAEFWPGIGAAPTIGQLDELAWAELLLRTGVLTGWLGSASQVENAQEKAKDLIGQSLTIFESLQNLPRLAEARSDLAYCFWRQGGFDEARILLQSALSLLPNEERQVRSVVLLRMALLENCAARYDDSILILTEALPLFGDEGANHALRGKFHNTLALALKNLGTAARQEDSLDQALIEFTAASFHFEEAGHNRYCARVENNLGFLLATIGRFEEAHIHLDRARRLFVSLNDRGSEAQVGDTRARTLLLEGRPLEAEVVARAAVATLQSGDELSMLADTLITLGVAQARIGEHEKSRSTLETAFETASHAGARESAGMALLATLEELCHQLKAGELVMFYEQTVELLAKSQDPNISNRLSSCRDHVLGAVNTLLILGPLKDTDDVTEGWVEFVFRKAIRRYERLFLERALKDADGHPTRAAQLLGFKNHQSLISLINSQHPDLNYVRSTVRPRRRGILSDRHNAQGLGRQARDTQTKKIAVLRVSDNKSSETPVGDTLEVIHCDGRTASEILSNNVHFDLLLFDFDSPNASGFELVRRARTMRHRRRTPMIMLSLPQYESEAWAARVDAFLQKPEDVGKVHSTIVRLVRPRTRKS
jgi:tetratricopeptide (TPR) repeat protein/CheY-like chemotaxis protein